MVKYVKMGVLTYLIMFDLRRKEKNYSDFYNSVKDITFKYIFIYKIFDSIFPTALTGAVDV